jgi:hypothetical protein
METPAPSAKQPTIARSEVPMIDGAIEKEMNPQPSGFSAARWALYGVAHTVRGCSVRAGLPRHGTEGLQGHGGSFDLAKKANWSYTMMILVPDEVTTAALRLREQVQRRRRESDLNVRLQYFGEEASR